MTQSQFDFKKGQELKKEGMSLAASNKNKELIYARECAKGLAESKPFQTITIDDVQEWMSNFGHNLLGNAAGSVFKESCWECVGFVKSKRTSNHARIIRQWRLK